jgi:hypothetical protein
MSRSREAEKDDSDTSSLVKWSPNLRLKRPQSNLAS